MICDNRIKSKGNASAQNNPDSLPNPLHLGLSKVVKLKGWLSVVRQECKVPIFKISTVANYHSNHPFEITNSQPSANLS